MISSGLWSHLPDYLHSFKSSPAAMLASSVFFTRSSEWQSPGPVDQQCNLIRLLIHIDNNLFNEDRTIRCLRRKFVVGACQTDSRSLASCRSTALSGADVDCSTASLSCNGWEAISDSAKKTKITPGIVRFGNAVAAGGAQFSFVRKSSLAPGEKVIIEDKIAPFEALAPGEYKLHVYLFSRYATELNKPEQELVQEFSIVPWTLSSRKDR